MLAEYSRVVRALAAAVGLAVAVGLAGCAAAPTPVAVPIQIGNTYVPVPAVGRLHRGVRGHPQQRSADRLMSARTSAGGRVAFRAPARPGALTMHTVSSIAIPAHSTVAMVPDGYHMLITGAGPIRGGKDITLTLVFAHAGLVSVVALVTNPATGGSTYFLN